MVNKNLSPTYDLAAELQKNIVKAIKETYLVEILENITPEIQARLVEQIGDIPKTIIEVKTIDGDTHKVVEHTHFMFEKVLRVTGAGIPVFLVGAAGTGKNVICKQVADALGLDFYFSNAVTNEFKVTGFIDAAGTYHETQFYQAFTKGGLFMLDEVDASIPEVLVILNAALANGYFDFPTGRVDAHPNFRVIAAGNTIGLGADRQYVGRYQLDAATLDRFVKVDIDYDPDIETEMAGGDSELLEFMREVRRICDAKRIRCIVSYRTISQAYKLMNIAGLAANDALSLSICKSLSRDDMRIIYDNFNNRSAKYPLAFKTVMNNVQG